MYKPESMKERMSNISRRVKIKSNTQLLASEITEIKRTFVVFMSDVAVIAKRIYELENT